KRVHPVPLPGGRGQPAHDRRDRPIRQDSRIQVLRGQHRPGGRPRKRIGRRVRTVTITANQQPAVPGGEARAAKLRGPSLTPMLMEIQGRLGWLPREELEALAREHKRPLYEIQGLVSFYPHFRTEPPTGVTVRVCHDLACWLNGAEDRIARLHEQYGDAGDVE